MTFPRFSAQEIARLKKQAKLLAKQQGLQHSLALDLVAKQHGYGNWSQLGKGAPKAPPSKHALRKWFAANHVFLGSRPTSFTIQMDAPSQPVGAAEGFECRSANVLGVLETAFPDATAADLEAVTQSYNAEGRYVDRAYKQLCEGGWHHSTNGNSGHNWLPPLGKTTLRSAEVLGIDQDVHTFKVACVRIFDLTEVPEDTGSLYFRCPVCGTVHVHGPVKRQFGAGDGTRVPHCPIPSALKSFQYELVEVIEPQRAGQLSPKLLSMIRPSSQDILAM